MIDGGPNVFEELPPNIAPDLQILLRLEVIVFKPDQGIRAHKAGPYLPPTSLQS